MAKNTNLNKAFLSLDDIDKQETLSLERIKSINYDKYNKIDVSNRPKESFIDLINWVELSFGQEISTKNNEIIKLVHNKIVIDGQFLQFCVETKTDIKALYKDAIVSWKTEMGGEKFFMQGVFAISNKNMKFLHSALFHKGNQNEDEISFCILVDNNNYNAYIDFRNQYEEWSSKRDRSNLVIKVMDGEDIPYDRDKKWDDLFLPDDLKNGIQSSVEGFLKSENLYAKKGIPWKRGIILHGPAGCGKSSSIQTIISNYDFKPITVHPGANDDTIMEAFSYAQSQGPSLLYFEDLDSILQEVNLSLFLNLMDGISSKSGIFVIATANDLSGFKDNIKDRPSRFDRKFEFPLPNKLMLKQYMKKWFGNIVKSKDLDGLVEIAFKYKFSYAYIKELYISAMYMAIADGREDPTHENIKNALQQIMVDKCGKTKTIGIDKYLK